MKRRNTSTRREEDVKLRVKWGTIKKQQRTKKSIDTNAKEKESSSWRNHLSLVHCGNHAPIRLPSSRKLRRNWPRPCVNDHNPRRTARKEQGCRILYFHGRQIHKLLNAGCDQQATVTTPANATHERSSLPDHTSPSFRWWPVSFVGLCGS